MGKYYWIFNLDRCIGCESCVLACKQEHNTLPGIQYRRLHIVNPELYPEFPTYRISIACNHCEDPACLKGCPVNAYRKRNGIVIHHPNECIGCRYCLWVCPYDAPQYSKQKRKVEKCDLCEERLIRGLEPACVSACPTQALELVEHLDSSIQGNVLTTIPGFPEDETQVKLRLKGTRRIDGVQGFSKRRER